MAKQPGVLVYFDIRPALKRLSTEEKGILFEAILDYGESGIIPAFDGTIGVAWDFVQIMIDRDKERYLQVCEKRKSAANSRWDRNKSMHVDAHDAIASKCMQLMPTSTSTSTSTSTTTPTPKESAAQGAPPAPSSARPKRKKYGEFGWVKLTDEEHRRLLNDLGESEVERCIRYVDEAAQSTGNKNKWRDWNLTIRRCSRDGWGLQSGKSTMQRVRTPADYENDPEF